MIRFAKRIGWYTTNTSSVYGSAIPSVTYFTVRMLNDNALKHRYSSAARDLEAMAKALLND